MHHLICVLLREPDLILESDPLHDILKLWHDHGIHNAMILDRVSIPNMARLYTQTLMSQLQLDGGNGDLAVLFGLPEPTKAEEETPNTHRIILAITTHDAPTVETLLDETATISQRARHDQRALLFVFPLNHVRGFTH